MPYKTNMQNPNMQRIAKPQRIGQILKKPITRVIEQCGVSPMRLYKDWSWIIGRDLAHKCQPVKISGRVSGRVSSQKAKENQKAKEKQPQNKSGGVLHILAEGPAVTELTFREQTIVSRVNRYFGFEVITRIKVQQATGAVQAPIASLPPAPPDPQKTQKAAEKFASIPDPDLRQQLVRIAQRLS